MRQLVIHLLALLAQHNIREVVILVDDEIHRDAESVGNSGDHYQFVCPGSRFKEFLYEIVRIISGVFPNEVIQLAHHILVELLLQFINSASYSREIEMHHLVASHQFGGMLAYPQLAEYFLKLVFLRLVVVCLEHAQQQALAEAARADKHQVIWLCLKLRYIHGFIDVIKVAPHYVLEV